MKRLPIVFSLLLLVFASAPSYGAPPNDKELKKMSRQGKLNPESPRYVVNGVIFNTIKHIPVEDIAQISVYPFDPETVQLGQRVVYGMLEVELKTDETANEPISGIVHNPELMKTQPSFMGGDITQFYSWFNSKIDYPVIALEKLIGGIVVVRFIVDERGIISDIAILGSAGKILDKCVVSLLKDAPGWLPCIENGKPQKVEFTMPVTFEVSTN